MVRRKKSVCLILILVNYIIFVLGLLLNEISVLYVSCIFEIIINLITAWSEWKRNIVFVFFNLCVFLFCLSKPLAAFILGQDYWITSRQDGFIFAFILIYISMLAFSFVICFYNGKILVKKISCENCVMQKVSCIIFILSTIALLYEIVGILYFFRSHSYLDFYNGVYSRDYIPVIIKVLIQFQVPSMCMCLSTKPSRKLGYFVLFLYLASNVSMLIIGKRAAFMLAFLFCIVYCILRDSEQSNQLFDSFMSKSKKWLGERKIRLLVIITPIAILGLTLMNEFRNGIYSSTMIDKKLHHPISYFLYEQGSTLDLLTSYYSIKDVIPDKFYFFGSFYDTFFYNALISKLFGIQVYTGTTQEYLATTHTIAAQLSYNIHGANYFLGNSVDSSYLIDMFADFGWIGVFIISILFALFMLKIPELLNKGWLTKTIILQCLIGIFFVPRAMFMSQFSFIISPYFWIVIIICYIPINVISRKNFFYSCIYKYKK